MANPNPTHKWKKGESGNPKGRKKKGETLTDALEAVVDKDELAALLTKMAFEHGDFQAAKYIYDRIDGKPKETVHNLIENLPDVVEVE